MERVSELIGADRIDARVRTLATEVAAAAGEVTDLLVLVVLKGAFVFAADLLRALDAEGVAPAVDFLAVSSYGTGTVSSGEVTLRSAPALAVAGRDVLVVDDIVDTGHSLTWIKTFLEREGARRVRTCVLLDKPSRRAVDLRPDFVGFEVPNRFLVGYGLDCDERWRHLPYVGAVDE